MIPHVARVSTGRGQWRGRRGWFILDAMLLFYLDEFGNGSHSIASINEYPHFVMGSMCIGDSQRWSLFQHVVEMKERFFPGWKLHDWKYSEIKGKHLARAMRRLETAKFPHPMVCPTHPSLGSRMIDGLFQIFHRFTPVFHFVGVDKRQVQSTPIGPTSPIGAAYVVLQLQAARLIEEVHGMGVGGLFIADEQNQHERLFRRGDIQSLREYVLGIAGHPPDMRGLLDKPLWVNKGELAVDREILQLIDFAVFIIGRAIASQDWENEWFNRLSPHIARNWLEDRIWNGGIAVFPPTDNHPPL